MEVSITDDTEAEATESFTLRLIQPLGSELTSVLISPQDMTVQILDDDCELFPRLVVFHSILFPLYMHSVAITFKKPEYIISEDDGSLQTCIRVMGGSFSQPLLLTLSTLQDTATGRDMYKLC